MKRKSTLLLLALVATLTLTLPAHADGPVCGTMSNPSFICPSARTFATGRTSPSILSRAGFFKDRCLGSLWRFQY
jgi:hypothetical protein